jgi:acyl carrier protein
MDGEELRLAIKRLIVKELNLKGRDPEAIDDDAPLFGAGGAAGAAGAAGGNDVAVVGLGLDSLDALQLAMSLEETFKVRIPDGEQARTIFRSVRAIADHVSRSRAPGA